MYKREKELLKHYNNNVNYHSQSPERSWSLFREHVDITPASRVLDLGCGDGRWLNYLHEEYNCKLYGVDYSRERIKKAREMSNSDIRYWNQDAYSFTKNYKVDKWGKFDYVLMVEFLEHLENPKRILKRLKQISKNIIGTVPLNFPYKAHLQVFKSEQDFKSRFPEWDIKTFVKDNNKDGNIYFYTQDMEK